MATAGQLSSALCSCRTIPLGALSMHPSAPANTTVDRQHHTAGRPVWGVLHRTLFVEHHEVRWSFGRIPTHVSGS